MTIPNISPLVRFFVFRTSQIVHCSPSSTFTMINQTDPNTRSGCSSSSAKSRSMDMSGKDSNSDGDADAGNMRITADVVKMVTKAIQASQPSLKLTTAARSKLHESCKTKCINTFYDSQMLNEYINKQFKIAKNEKKEKDTALQSQPRGSTERAETAVKGKKRTKEQMSVLREIIKTVFDNRSATDAVMSSSSRRQSSLMNETEIAEVQALYTVSYPAPDVVMPSREVILAEFRTATSNPDSDDHSKKKHRTSAAKVGDGDNDDDDNGNESDGHEADAEGEHSMKRMSSSNMTILLSFIKTKFENDMDMKSLNNDDMADIIASCQGKGFLVTDVYVKSKINRALNRPVKTMGPRRSAAEITLQRQGVEQRRNDRQTKKAKEEAFLAECNSKAEAKVYFSYL